MNKEQEYVRYQRLLAGVDQLQQQFDNVKALHLMLSGFKYQTAT